MMPVSQTKVRNDVGCAADVDGTITHKVVGKLSKCSPDKISDEAQNAQKAVLLGAGGGSSGIGAAVVELSTAIQVSLGFHFWWFSQLPCP